MSSRCATSASLRGITYDDKLGLRIGALTLHSELARSPLVRTHFPMLADMASRLANPQVRNQGTIGGNLCYADPATDPPSCLMALDAEVVLSSAKGSRILKIEDFVLDYFVTALGRGRTGLRNPRAAVRRSMPAIMRASCAPRPSIARWSISRSPRRRAAMSARTCGWSSAPRPRSRRACERPRAI